MPVLESKNAGNGAAPKQHSQPSRKGKKAWRKNVDVTDVQEGLEELNKEIIQGGVIKERPSEQLFSLDVKGDAALEKKFNKHIKKGLKADEIINARSPVPAVSMRKRPGDKTTDGILPAKRHKSGWVTHKELSRLKRVADGQHDNTVQVQDATYDIWDMPAAPKEKEIDNFLAEEVKPKVPKSMKKEPLSLLESGKQIPAVLKPGGAYSYNPDFTDYSERLEEEKEKALEAEKQRLEQEEREREKQEAAARSAAEAEAAEARANLSEWEEDSEWEGLQSGAEDSKPSVKRPQRKTQTQRNRIKRRKEEEQLLKHKAAIKAQRRQEQRIREIAEEIEEKERNKALVSKDDDSADPIDELREEKLRRKQLGKYKLPQHDLELVLPDELEDSLRRLKPEGNLLRDRYRSLMVRGKVESRRHIPFHKQAKGKYTEKWTYKDFKI